MKGPDSLIMKYILPICVCAVESKEVTDYEIESFNDNDDEYDFAHYDAEDCDSEDYDSKEYDNESAYHDNSSN
ncbi:uncharacterized protein N7503_010235 [Penicillium pulvis]|uniref:uncharacterized protein n=1 Tax=Penicillium pulvis TaxID=1562058 RepID=UPI00254695A2|nr:uncharacterized protein N7503_010235 [Penicillium pulvis]KAJ5785023.1 hypothetical protein N7503_010235 [Penicillium pulvis]